MTLAVITFILYSMEWLYNDLMEWDDSVGPIPNVVTLNISHKGLTELPMKIFKLISLQKFNCSYNKLTELPKEIGQLISLQKFDCSCNKLTELSPMFGDNKTNEFGELPKEIGNIGSGKNNINCDELNSSSCNQLISLKVFNCHNNKLTELPKEIGQLVSLCEFYCSYNKLTELPKEISQLISLQEFDCNFNKLTKLPKEIGQLISLQVFNCHNNKLTELPKEIGNIVSLQVFNCHNNPMANIKFSLHKNNLEEIKQYFALNELILTKAKKLFALLKIQSFISQKVIPKYFDMDESIYLSI